MGQKRYDLHTHSIFSDGSYLPKELIESAIKIGLSGLSITDHDNIDAYTENPEILNHKDLKILPGCEISCQNQGESVHILCYSFSPKDERLINFLEGCLARRRQRNLDMIAKLKQSEIYLEVEEMEDFFQRPLKVLGRPHLARMMLVKNYIKDFKQAFEKLIGEGCPCFVEGDRPSTLEVIDFIHSINGYAILAHPHVYKCGRLIKSLLSQPFDGLEAFYAKFPPPQETKWINLANNRNWMKTGGSDFHGVNKSFIPLGCSWVGEDVFDQLYQRYVKNDELQRGLSNPI